MTSVYSDFDVVEGWMIQFKLTLLVTSRKIKAKAMIYFQHHLPDTLEFALLQASQSVI
jgi:hypothetical protein